MKIINEIDFKRETINFFYKIYSDEDIDTKYKDEYIKSGAPIDDIKHLFINYYELKDKFAKEALIPKDLIPFFKIGINNISFLSKLYFKYINTSKLPYITFLNRFFEIDLQLKDDYSNNLEFKDILAIVNSLDIEDQDKLSLINFYTGGEELFNKILECIYEASKIVEKYYYIVKPEVEELLDELHNTNTLEDTLRAYIEDLNFNSELEISISIADYSYISHSVIENKNRYIYLGYLALKLSNIIRNYENDEESALSKLKSLSDPTRYKILKILSKKQAYGSEIAGILGLSAATINHHLNILVNNKLLKIYFEDDDNKKVYYDVNKQVLSHVLNTIGSNLLWKNTRF